MIRFSANLGFLWKDRPLPDAIRAAASSGFDAVECHAPYDRPSCEVHDTLDSVGLRMLSLNTRTGEPGEVGVAALPGRESVARQFIDEAIDYAAAIGCPAVSVVAGISGRTEEAERTYRANLTYAASSAADHGITVLIEPLNTGVSPDYHLVSVDAALKTIHAVGAPNIKIMFDTFHVSVMDGDIAPVFARAAEHIGHVQIASIPVRAEPDGGEVDYAALLPWMVSLGYDKPFGAEYTPAAAVESGLTWMRTLRGGNDG